MAETKRVEDDVVLKKIYDRELLSRLFAFGKPYWYLILLAVILIIFGMGLELLGH